MTFHSSHPALVPVHCACWQWSLFLLECQSWTHQWLLSGKKKMKWIHLFRGDDAYPVKRTWSWNLRQTVLAFSWGRWLGSWCVIALFLMSLLCCCVYRQLSFSSEMLTDEIWNLILLLAPGKCLGRAESGGLHTGTGGLRFWFWQATDLGCLLYVGM